MTRKCTRVRETVVTKREALEFIGTRRKQLDRSFELGHLKCAKFLAGLLAEELTDFLVSFGEIESKTINCSACSPVYKPGRWI